MEELDDVARSKLALRERGRAQGQLLAFQAPALERQYKSWYCAGQVPVDLAFLVIAILSQGAWIFRWSLDASWLGRAMLALMAINAVVMQVSVVCRGAAGGGRQDVCALDLSNWH